jgi:hypothetical protein
MIGKVYLQSHTFAEPTPPDIREEIHDWLYDHGETCQGVYDGRKTGSWYALTESGFRIYNSGWVVKN